MPRRFTALILLLGTAFAMVTPEESEAQGLIQRLRNRVESRRNETQDPSNDARTPPLTETLTDPSSPAMQALRSLLEPAPDSGSGQNVPQAGDGNTNLRPNYGGPGLQNRLRPNSGLASPQQTSPPTTNTPAGPSLGIHVVPSDTGTPGLVVSSIGEHSLADESGLRVGDTIISMNGAPTYTTDAVAQQLRRLAIGERVRLQFIRDGRLQQIELPLVAFQSTNPFATPSTPDKRPTSGLPAGRPPISSDRWNPQMLGLTLTESPTRRGLIVAGVEPGSIAADAGIKQDDRIVAVDGRLIAGSDSFDRELDRYDTSSNIAVKIVRGNSLVAADLSTTPKVRQDAPAKPSNASPLGGIGSVFNGLFGGGTAKQTPPAADSPSDPADGSHAETPPPNPPKSGEAAKLPPATNAESDVEQAGFQTRSNRMPLPSLETDPPSLLPAPVPDSKRQLDELKKQEQEIRLELLKLQERIKQLQQGNRR